MLLIPPVQLPHKTLKLREISIGDAIALLKLNPEAHEQTISQFLACTLDGAEGRLLTVQERYLLVAHYISATCDGSPNFPIGEHKYSDYLSMEQAKCPDSVYLGLEEQWTMHHLYGWQAEAIEAISSNWQDWIFGCMAAQLTKHDETQPSTVPDAAYQEWLQERVRILKAYPERDFVVLYQHFSWGMEQLKHYFELGFDNQGLVCRHKKGGAGFSPARFQVSDSFTETTISFNR